VLRRSARLDRDDLDFAVAALEEIVLDHREGTALRELAGADPNRLPAICAERGPGSEIIMVDAVAVIEWDVGGADHDQHRAAIGLASEMRMVDAVVAAVERDPVIGVGLVGLGEAVDHHAGEARILGPALAAVAKGDQFLAAGMAVAEYQIRDDQIFARHPQARPAGKGHLARRLGGERDRPGRGAFARETDREIAPLAIGQDDAIPRDERLGCAGIFLLIADQMVTGFDGGGERRNGHDRNHPESQRPGSLSPCRLSRSMAVDYQSAS
jgi:hypothetical protein